MIKINNNDNDIFQKYQMNFHFDIEKKQCILFYLKKKKIITTEVFMAPWNEKFCIELIIHQFFNIFIYFVFFSHVVVKFGTAIAKRPQNSSIAFFPSKLPANRLTPLRWLSTQGFGTKVSIWIRSCHSSYEFSVQQ